MNTDLGFTFWLTACNISLFDCREGFQNQNQRKMKETHRLLWVPTLFCSLSQRSAKNLPISSLVQLRCLENFWGSQVADFCVNCQDLSRNGWKTWRCVRKDGITYPSAEHFFQVGDGRMPQMCILCIYQNSTLLWYEALIWYILRSQSGRFGRSQLWWDFWKLLWQWMHRVIGLLASTYTPLLCPYIL